ncbi:MAG: hypothetical protein OXE99_04685 [Cellvibrionales bacterium]|nr:hypothetical protein [Cellvibrionales bacterium]
MKLRKLNVIFLVCSMLPLLGCEKKAEGNFAKGSILINAVSNLSPFSSFPVQVDKIEWIASDSTTTSISLRKPIDLAYTDPQFIHGLTLPEGEYIRMRVTLDYSRSRLFTMAINAPKDPLMGYWSFPRLFDAEGDELAKNLKQQSITLSLQTPVKVAAKKTQLLTLAFDLNTSLIPTTHTRDGYYFEPNIALMPNQSMLVPVVIEQVKDDSVQVHMNGIALEIPSPVYYVDGFAVTDPPNTARLKNKYASVQLITNDTGMIQAESINITHYNQFKGMIIPTDQGLGFAGHVKTPDGNLTFEREWLLPNTRIDVPESIDIQQLKPGQSVAFFMTPKGESHAILIHSSKLIAQLYEDENNEKRLLPISIDGKAASNFYKGGIAIDQNAVSSVAVGDIVQFTGTFKGNEDGVAFVLLDHHIIQQSKLEAFQKRVSRLTIQPKFDLIANLLTITQTDQGKYLPLSQFDEQTHAMLSDLQTGITLKSMVDIIEINDLSLIRLQLHNNENQSTVQFKTIDQMLTMIENYYSAFSIFHIELSGKQEHATFYAESITLSIRDKRQINTTLVDALEESQHASNKKDNKHKLIIVGSALVGIAILAPTAYYLLKKKSQAASPTPIPPTPAPAPEVPKNANILDTFKDKYHNEILLRQSEFTKDEKQLFNDSIELLLKEKVIAISDLNKTQLEHIVKKNKGAIVSYFKEKYGESYSNHTSVFSRQDISLYNEHEGLLNPNKQDLTSLSPEQGEMYFYEKYGRDINYWFVLSITDLLTNQELDLLDTIPDQDLLDEPENTYQHDHAKKGWRSNKAKFIKKIEQKYGKQWINKIDTFENTAENSEYNDLKNYFPYLLNTADKTQILNELSNKYPNYPNHLEELTHLDFQKHLKASFTPIDLSDVKFVQKDRDPIKYVFRADNRPPEEIFKYGFSPLGNNIDFLYHLDNAGGRPNRAFISTTKSLEATATFLTKNHGQDYIYIIENNNDLASIDTYKWFQKHPETKYKYEKEQEVAFKRIPAESIKGVLVKPAIDSDIDVNTNKNVTSETELRNKDWVKEPSWLANPHFKKK